MRKDPFPRLGACAALCLSLALGCASGAGKAAKQTPVSPSNQVSPMDSAKTVHPDVIKRFCGQPPGPVPRIVKVLKDSAGHIGGYTHSLRKPDSPIYYLDAEGKDYAMFHIFGSDEEKAKNKPLIDKLRKAYPVEEPLACP